MAVISEQAILDHCWEMNLASFAERMSRGRWIAFRWLKYVLGEVQKEICAGGARLILNAPPRMGKSESISHWTNLWYENWYPENNAILASYGDRQAAKYGRKVLDDIKADNGKLLNVKLHPKHRTAADWQTTKGGGMRSVGIGGSVVGSGGHLITIDDPHKDWAEAMSAGMRQRVIDWFQGTLYTRLEPGGSIVLIMTRWHERDLTGYLTDEHEDDWRVIRLPALAETGDELGRKEGEALCPERFDETDLQAMKRSHTGHPTIWIGQYQQRPTTPEGNIVKRQWIGRYKELPAQIDQWIQSWDLNFDESEKGSFVVGQVWARVGPRFYLVHQYRERVDFVETVAAIRRTSTQWPEAATKLVEKKANGAAVLSYLGKELPGMVPYEPRGSKLARLMAVAGLFAAGNVFVPEGQIWAEECVDEWAAFPNAPNDDQVDATSQALSYLYQPSTFVSFNIPEAGEQTSQWEIH